MTSFPTAGAYHGIATPNDYENLDRGRLSPTAFIFKASSDSRSDATEECSISWADSDEALYMLADQVKYDGKTGVCRPQFRGGACRIPLSSLEELKGAYPECFDYNREPMDYRGRYGVQLNAHHGNMLILNANTKAVKKAKKMIVSILAYLASSPHSDVYSREELDTLLDGEPDVSA